MPTVLFPHLGKGMVATTPQILNMTQPDPFERQTILNLMSLADSSPNCMSFRLSSNIDLPTSKDSTMIASRDNLLNGLVLELEVNIF